MYLIKIFNLGLMYMYVSIYVRLDTSKCRRQHEKGALLNIIVSLFSKAEEWILMCSESM